MIKYTYGLVACLVASSIMFASDITPNLKYSELLRRESNLIVATTVLKKNQGKNSTAVGATWNQIEVLQDTIDYIGDRRKEQRRAIRNQTSED